MKRLHTHSQNFLRSPRLVKELIGHTTIKKSDTVIDIGAGSGIIASALASRASRVIAYEYDKRMMPKLHGNLSRFSNVTVIEDDFLLATLPNFHYKVFANIPFHLSSPILKKLTESDQRPDAIYLIVQKQFANKLLIDKDGFTGMLGAQIAPTYIARVRKRLHKNDYWPHPAVDTVLLELLKRDSFLIPEDQLEFYREFIRESFASPEFFAKTSRASANISISKKPSQLHAHEWKALFEKHI